MAAGLPSTVPPPDEGLDLTFARNLVLPLLLQVVARCLTRWSSAVCNCTPTLSCSEHMGTRAAPLSMSTPLSSRRGPSNDGASGHCGNRPKFGFRNKGLTGLYVTDIGASTATIIRRGFRMSCYGTKHRPFCADIVGVMAICYSRRSFLNGYSK